MTNPMPDLTALAAPFPAADIEWRAGSTNREKTRAMALPYITSRAVMDRLDAVCGVMGWSDDYTEGPSGGVLCGISIQGEERWVTKWDGAENTQFESVKGGLSDAFKRAAVKWGIGRYLYNIPIQWVACEQRGKSVVLTTTPQLPAWALPDTDANPPQKRQDAPRAAKKANDRYNVLKLSGDAVTVPEADKGQRQSGNGSSRPLKPADLRNFIIKKSEGYDKQGRSASDKQLAFVRILLSDVFNDDDQRHTGTAYLLGKTSTTELTDGEILALIDWIGPEKTKDDGYIPGADAIIEAQAVITEALKEEGQKEMGI